MFKIGDIITTDHRYVIKRGKLVSKVVNGLCDVLILDVNGSSTNEWQPGDVRCINISEYQLDESYTISKILEAYEFKVGDFITCRTSGKYTTRRGKILSTPIDNRCAVLILELQPGQEKGPGDIEAVDLPYYKLDESSRISNILKAYE